MSKKYYDRLLVGSGSTSKEVKSKYGERMLAMMGWEKGKGLGKNMDGMTECVQIKRRDEGEALGAVKNTPSANFKWNDSFWDDVYNKAASKMTEVAADVNQNKSLVKEGNSTTSSDSEQSESEMSDFSFDIEVSKTKLKSKPEKVEKSKKSKSIKKEKESKKDKKEKKDKKSKKEKKKSK